MSNRKKQKFQCNAFEGLMLKESQRKYFKNEKRFRNLKAYCLLVFNELKF